MGHGHFPREGVDSIQTRSKKWQFFLFLSTEVCLEGAQRTGRSAWSRSAPSQAGALRRAWQPASSRRKDVTRGIFEAPRERGINSGLCLWFVTYRRKMCGVLIHLKPELCSRIFHTESQNGGGWKGPLWVTQPNPLPKQGHLQ